MVKYPNNDLYQSRKICAFQKVLKTTTSTQPYPPSPSPPPLRLAKSKVFSRRKGHLATAAIGGRLAPIPDKVCYWLGKQWRWWQCPYPWKQEVVQVIGTNEIRGLDGCRSIGYFLTATRRPKSNHGGRWGTDFPSYCHNYFIS